MGVREQHYVDFGRVEEEISVLFERFFPFALEQTAIEKDVFALIVTMWAEPVTSRAAVKVSFIVSRKKLTTNNTNIHKLYNIKEAKSKEVRK